MDFDRYECNGPRKDQQNSLPIWKKEIANCKSQYSHQLNATLNMELMKKYNAAQWSEYNNHLRRNNEFHTKQIEELQKKINNVNIERKLAQQEASPRLHRLQQEWWGLVRKNNEIELQSQILKSQMDGIRQIKQKYANMEKNEVVEIEDDEL